MTIGDEKLFRTNRNVKRRWDGTWTTTTYNMILSYKLYVINLPAPILSGNGALFDGAVVVDAVLEAVELPARVAHLHTGLAHVDRNNLAHFLNKDRLSKNRFKIDKSADGNSESYRQLKDL